MNPEIHRRESRPRASAGEWIQAVLLAVTLAWTILGLGGYPPQVMAVSIALTTVLGVVHATRLGIEWRRRPLSGECRRALLHPGALALWLFVPYAAANVIWVSPVPWLGWVDWAKWWQIAVVLAVASSALRASGPRRLVFSALAVIGVTGVALACFQRFVNPAWLMLGHGQAAQFLTRSSGPFGAPNSFAGLLLLIIPATAALTLRRGASAVERIGWGWVTAVLGLGLILTFSRGGWLALAMATVAVPLLGQRSGWVRRLRGVSLAMVAVLAIGSTVYVVSPQARERFGQLVQDQGERSRPILWQAAWELFREKPVFGTGAGSFETHFEFHRPDGFVDRPEWAHNDYLNTLSDYGLAGTLLLAVGVVLAVRPRRDAPATTIAKSRSGSDWSESAALRVGLGVGLLAFALQLIVEFHFKLPGLGLAFATVAGLALPYDGTEQTRGVTAGRGVRLLFPWLAAGGLLVAGVALGRILVAEAWRVEARAGVGRLGQVTVASMSDVEAITSRLRRAGTWAPANGSIWSDLADVTLLRATLEPESRESLGRVAELAADRALGCSTHVYEFWLQRGLARSLQNRWVEAGDDFVKAIALAPANARPWFYYAEHLSREPTRSALAVGALAFCLRLDPNHREAISLRQRLAASATVP